MTRTLATMARLTGVIRDEMGQPLANARIIITHAHGTLWSAQTGDTGEYNLPCLPAGTYTIDVLAEGQSALHDTVVLVNSQVQRDFNLVSNEGTVLTGRLVDALGRPIVGVNVLVSRQDGSVVGYVRSGTLGTFTVSTAQGSNLTVDVAGMGYLPIRMTGINLAAGTVVNLGNLNLTLAGLGSNPTVIGPSPLSHGGPTLQFPFGFGGPNFPGVHVSAQPAQQFRAPSNPAAAWIARINEDLAFGGFVGDPTWGELNSLVASMDPKCRAKCQPFIDRAIRALWLLKEMRAELSRAKADVISAMGNFVSAAGRDFLVAAGTLAAVGTFTLELGTLLGGEELVLGGFSLTGKGAITAAAEATTGFFNDLINIYNQMQTAANASSAQGLVNPLDGLPSELIRRSSQGRVRYVGCSGVKAIDLGLQGLDWVNLFSTLATGFVDNLQFQATRDTAEALDIYHKNLQNVIKTYTAQCIRARNAMNDLRLCQVNCDEDKTPEPPTPGIIGRIRPVGLRDPNEKLGAGGHAAPRFVTPGTLLPYTIFFENTPTQATAPAQEVFIDDYLDPDADWSTFEFGDVGFGDVVIHVPAGLQQFNTRVVYQNTNGTPLLVDVEMSFNRVTGHIRWVFRSVDPETGTLPEGAQDGFLPVNDDTGRGAGFVRYTVRAKANLITGTRVDNAASIIFDANDALVTNTVTNTIDHDAPTSSVAALAPIQSGTTFTVSWTGTDGLGSGIAAYDIYVSVAGGAFVLWQAQTTATAASFTGEVGRTYRFYSVAVDHVGWRQATPAGAQATTRIAVVSNAPRVIEV